MVHQFDKCYVKQILVHCFELQKKQILVAIISNHIIVNLGRNAETFTRINRVFDLSDSVYIQHQSNLIG